MIVTDREKLIELLENAPMLDATYGTRTEYEAAADHLLANGVTVQKHGRWEEIGNGWVRCTVCGDEWNGKEIPYEDFHHCPNCGARMDGE